MATLEAKSCAGVVCTLNLLDLIQERADLESPMVRLVKGPVKKFLMKLVASSVMYT